MLRTAAGLLLVALPITLVAQEQTDPRAAALAANKQAIEAGNVKSLAVVAAGKEGDVLRRLAEPYTKARMASERFDNALKERGINLANPFADSVSPLADLQCDIVEIAKEGGREIARVRFGPRGKTQEEAVQLLMEEGAWRVTLPAELGKELRNFDQKHLRDRIQGIERLADLLDTVAREVQAGTLKTKEETLVRMARLFGELKLKDLLG